MSKRRNLTEKELLKTRDEILACAALYVKAAQAAGYSPVTGAAACAHLRESFIQGNDVCATVIRLYEEMIVNSKADRATAAAIIDDALKQENAEHE